MQTHASSSDSLAAEAPPQPLTWLRRVFYHPATRRLALGVVGLLTVLIMFYAAFLSFSIGVPGYDRAITESLQAFNFGPFTPFLVAVSTPGYSPWNFGLVAIAVVLVGWWLHWKVGLYVAGLTLAQGVATVLPKYPIRIPRPMETDLNAPVGAIAQSSFPSGHATLYVVLFGFLVYLAWRHGAPRWIRLGGLVLALVLIVLVGPSRLHMGAHWVIDMVAAYLLGMFFLLLGIELYERWLLPRLDLECVALLDDEGAA